MDSGSIGLASSGFRTAVRVCRRSVRAGAFACELATRRRWLGTRDAQWIAENLLSLRGFAVDLSGDVDRASAGAALVIAEPSAQAALAIMAAVPLASVGPSLVAAGEPWWPHGPGAPLLLSAGDREALDGLARAGEHVIPVAVRLTLPARSALGAFLPVRSGVTQIELRLGAPLRLGHDAAASVREEIDSLLPAAA
jgi:hypothetical protein